MDRIVRIYFDTRADVNPEVLKVVRNADKIIFAPGDLYTSILPHLLVDGVREAILNSKAKIIFVLNLCTKKGETEYYHASDFIKSLLFYLGNTDREIYVIADSTKLDEDVVKVYKDEGQELVELDEDRCLKLSPNIKIVKNEVGTYLYKEHLIRHDSLKLAESILKI